MSSDESQDPVEVTAIDSDSETDQLSAANDESQDLAEVAITAIDNDSDAEQLPAAKKRNVYGVKFRQTWQLVRFSIYLVTSLYSLLNLIVEL